MSKRDEFVVNITQETNLMIKISQDLKAKVQKKAKQNDLTMSQIVRRLLTDYVSEKQEKLNF